MNKRKGFLLGLGSVAAVLAICGAAWSALAIARLGGL